MELHDTQTGLWIIAAPTGLITLWNYTTLKHKYLIEMILRCLITLWNYTTLKLTTYGFIS